MGVPHENEGIDGPSFLYVALRTNGNVLGRHFLFAIGPVDFIVHVDQPLSNGCCAAQSSVTQAVEVLTEVTLA